MCCLSLHAPGRAIVDTGCGRCVVGAQTLEEPRAKLGPDADDVQWQNTLPTVTLYSGNGTKDRRLGVVDVTCLVGALHVVPADVLCISSKGWLKDGGRSSTHKRGC